MTLFPDFFTLPHQLEMFTLRSYNWRSNFCFLFTPHDVTHPKRKIVTFTLVGNDRKTFHIRINPDFSMNNASVMCVTEKHNSPWFGFCYTHKRRSAGFTGYTFPVLESRKFHQYAQPEVGSMATTMIFFPLKVKKARSPDLTLS